MTIEERCTNVLATPQSRYIIDTIIFKIITKFNIDRNLLLNNSKYYIKELLYSYRRLRMQIDRVYEKAKRKNNYLKLLEATLVRGANSEINDAGKTTGGYIPNNVEDRLVRINQTKTELEDLIYDLHLQEKKLEQDANVVMQFVDLLPQTQYNKIIDLVYFQDLSYKEVGDKLCVSAEYAKLMKNRAISILAKLLEKGINYC